MQLKSLLKLRLLFESPRREYLVIIMMISGLAIDFFIPQASYFLFAAAIAGAAPTTWKALIALTEKRISIDTFNIFALGAAFIAQDSRSSAFIILMLSFADLLEWQISSRSQHAIKELLKLKPQKALLEIPGGTKEVLFEDIRVGDVLVVETGARIPIDGKIIFGKSLVNESSVTGESTPIEKMAGDTVLGGTLNETGVIKVRAVRVGKDSTIDRMAALIQEAQKNKSRSERLADRFASIFLPIVLLGGIAVYIVTRDILMTSAIFLVACADDMAVAIPLAVAASIGKAAKRGVVVKGGEWMTALGKINTLVLDKTGTLTYGTFSLDKFLITGSITEDKFWKLAGAAEKFSEHPIGRAIFREAEKRVKEIPNPDEIKIHQGGGIWTRLGKEEVAIGGEGLLPLLKVNLTAKAKKEWEKIQQESAGTVVTVIINKKIVGFIGVADIPRQEAKKSLDEVRNLGVKNILMLTGDTQQIASRISENLGITSFSASMKPEDKVRKIEELEQGGAVAMVGDGINDAPALARARVGIAMGHTGTEVSVEAANIVILTDNLNRLPEMIALSRMTSSVIRWDIVIWMASNILGFALVLTGIAGPALAAFYNFATDFFPLLNSARLFRKKIIIKN